MWGLSSLVPSISPFSFSFTRPAVSQKSFSCLVAKHHNIHSEEERGLKQYLQIIHCHGVIKAFNNPWSKTSKAATGLVCWKEKTKDRYQIRRNLDEVDYCHFFPCWDKHDNTWRASSMICYQDTAINLHNSVCCTQWGLGVA